MYSTVCFPAGNSMLRRPSHSVIQNPLPGALLIRGSMLILTGCGTENSRRNPIGERVCGFLNSKPSTDQRSLSPFLAVVIHSAEPVPGISLLSSPEPEKVQRLPRFSGWISAPEKSCRYSNSANAGTARKNAARIGSIVFMVSGFLLNGWTV
ncbi:hypothetical protein SDC9_179450 [bioreactor metagenome]|uniref:Uncharacterized protein n=1 Tax=bioreactor metagenome TaxID=1076179 RepID=A0A645GYS6_9ZZZZ